MLTGLPDLRDVCIIGWNNYEEKAYAQKIFKEMLAAPQDGIRFSRLVLDHVPLDDGVRGLLEELGERQRNNGSLLDIDYVQCETLDEEENM